MGRIKKLSTLMETKFISLYDIKYLNKSNKEKSWTVASRKKKEQLNNKINQKRQDQLSNIVEYASTQSSERERAAELAERDVHDYYKACYMADKVGQEFEVTISSVTN